MDNSRKLYAGHDLEMIRKAVEVQELWKIKDGDFAYNGIQNFVFVVKYPTPNYSMADKRVEENYRTIWLPRQDQLQKILSQSLKLYSDNGLLKLLNIFLDNYLSKNTSLKIMRDMSMEQLWLAFVMKEKFNKVWDGKDWIKEE